ncbi:MAG: hypothetical protein Q9M97_02325 [Candidatus Gracilibacteria bacterium]|nr:hypothetical protein [Candidatus Gracilibacteria bacterium]
MQKNTPYLDIYKNKTIVLQIGKDFDENSSFKAFLEYIFFLKQEDINIILVDKNGKEIFKINGKKDFFSEDSKISQKINNILILEENFEIQDIKNKQIEFISHKNLKKIISGEHKKIKINIEENYILFNKLKEIDKLLDNGNSKVTLTNLKGIKEELEGFGSGTMFIDLEKASFKNLNNLELFKQIYKKQFYNKKWKKRSEDELLELSNNYKILELEGTILGGYYLGNYEIELNGVLEKGKLLENLFSSKSGGGIGKILGEEIKKNKIIFAYSKEKDFLEKLGFKLVKGKKSETGADLWKYEKIVNF